MFSFTARLLIATDQLQREVEALLGRERAIIGAVSQVGGRVLQVNGNLSLHFPTLARGQRSLGIAPRASMSASARSTNFSLSALQSMSPLRVGARTHVYAAWCSGGTSDGSTSVGNV
jgi:hypothetical protein